MPTLFPIPKRRVPLGQRFNCPKQIFLLIEKRAFPHAEDAVAFANQSVARKSFLSLDSTPPESFTLRATRAAHGSPQSYRLRISKDGCLVEAPDDAGFRYALITLAQLYRSSNGIESQEIEDAPDLAQRGFMLDISRCKVPKLETLFLLIDRLAQLKYNQLQLYMEHTFAYREHDTVWRDASPYTPEEIRKIDRFCAARGIELVPSQNSFGHLERWLRHPEYQHLAESPNGYIHPILGPLDHGGTLKPDDDSFEFIRSLHDELLPNFTSRKFNIGCDETWELGQGWSRSLAEKSGKRRVYLDFLKRISQSAVDRGLQPQFWGDIILEQPELVKELPPELCALVWGYEADHPFEEQLVAFRAAGIDFVVAPGTSTWNSIGGRWPNAKRNIERALANAIEQNAEGMLLADWGDHGHHQPYAVSLPPIVEAAGLSWNYHGNQEIDAIRAACELFFDPGATSTLADAFETLGSIYLNAGAPLPNATLLNKLLFANRPEAEALRADLDPEGIARIPEQLAQLQIRIGSATTEDCETRKSLDRLALAAELLRFASEKGIELLDNRWDPDRHSKQAEALEPQFKAQWLEDNRPGGLEESGARLKRQ